jgi:hypothetical protein
LQALGVSARAGALAEAGRAQFGMTLMPWAAAAVDLTSLKPVWPGQVNLFGQY